jgi:hypothetical protein
MRDDDEIFPQENFPEGTEAIEEEPIFGTDPEEFLGLGLDDEGEERGEDDPGLDFNH